MKRSEDDRFAALQQAALDANLALVRHGLVMLTWGNASAHDRQQGVIAIKPSGIPYERLSTTDIVIVDVASGATVLGTARPSSDTRTHLALYRAAPELGGIVHTHSHYATAWAQSGRDIPCLGTTHADYFHGPIPCTASLSEAEIASDYEGRTGDLIVRTLRERGLSWAEMPGVIVRGHAPFAWGRTPDQAVENACVLEEVARMAMHTTLIAPAGPALDAGVLEKHYSRKHGVGAYYGQSDSAPPHAAGEDARLSTDRSSPTVEGNH